MTTQPIEKLNERALRKYAKDRFNQELDPNLTKDGMLQQIKLWADLAGDDAEPTRIISDEPEDTVTATAAEPQIAAESKYRIVIHGQNAGGEADKFCDVGVNGTVWRIRRDVEVSVPKRVVEVLRNAKMDIWNNETKDWQSVQRIPFSVIGNAA